MSEEGALGALRAPEESPPFKTITRMVMRMAKTKATTPAIVSQKFLLDGYAPCTWFSSSSYSFLDESKGLD